MVPARAFALPLALLSLGAFAACGGDDDDAPGASSSGGDDDASPSGSSSSSSSSSSGSATDGGGDGASDAGPPPKSGFAYSKGAPAGPRTVRYYDPTDGAAASDLSAAFEPGAWSQELVVSANGDHFAYGDAAGAIYVGHARRTGVAADVTGAPLAGGAAGRYDALLQEDGSLVYAGVYAEAGQVDVFRDGARLSTGAGRVTTADLSEATIALYANGNTVAWSLQSDDPLGTYVKWDAAASEATLAEATVVDAISPAACLTYYPEDTRTLLACNGAATIDLDVLAGTAVGSVESHWAASGAKLVTFVPQGGPDPVHVVTREGNIWSIAASGDFVDTQLLGRSEDGLHYAFSDGTAPLHLLDVTAAPHVLTPTVPDDFVPTGAAFSPDGARALVWSNTTLFVVGPAGPVQIPVGVGNTVAGAAWSPDGTRFLLAQVVTSHGSVSVVDGSNQVHVIASGDVFETRWASNDSLALLDTQHNLTVVAADGSTPANPDPVDTTVVDVFASIQIIPAL